MAATDTYGLYNTSMWSNSYGCKIQRSGTSGSYTYSVASDYANRPVNYVSWGDSARFANWLHNGQPGLITPVPQDQYSTEDGAYYLNGATTNAALLAVSRKADWKWAITSEDEWYKAAYYKGGATNAGYWDYPTSSNTVPSNVLGTPTDPGNNATFYNMARSAARTIGPRQVRTRTPTARMARSIRAATFGSGMRRSSGSSRGLRGADRSQLSRAACLPPSAATALRGSRTTASGSAW